MKKIKFSKLTISLVSSSVIYFLGGVDSVLAVPLDRNYNGEARSLHIDGYCRSKHGSDAWADVRNGDHKWYNWRCFYEAGEGASVGSTTGYNTGSSVIDRPVHLNDVCNWQYETWTKRYEAFRIGDNSGDIRCRRI